MTDAAKFPLLRQTLSAIRFGANAPEVSAAIGAWFTPGERAEIAAAALLTLDDDEAEIFLAHALADIRNGPPVAPLDGLAEEAWAWADIASLGELRCYLWACFNGLPLESWQRFFSAILAEAEGAAA